MKQPISNFTYGICLYLWYLYVICRVASMNLNWSIHRSIDRSIHSRFDSINHRFIRSFNANSNADPLLLLQSDGPSDLLRHRRSLSLQTNRMDGSNRDHFFCGCGSPASSSTALCSVLVFWFRAILLLLCWWLKRLLASLPSSSSSPPPPWGIWKQKQVNCGVPSNAALI